MYVGTGAHAAGEHHLDFMQVSDSVSTIRNPIAHHKRALNHLAWETYSVFVSTGLEISLLYHSLFYRQCGIKVHGWTWLPWLFHTAALI